MLQIKDILSTNKAMLLVTTSLIVSGCNTVAHQKYNANDAVQTPIAETTAQDDTGDLSFRRLIRIANRAWKRGDAATALRFYSMANKQSPNDPTPLLGAAEILRKTQRTDAALGIYRKITAKQPELVAAHIGIGYTFLAEDKPYLASKSFEVAVGLDNKNAKSLGGLALALDTAGEHDKAQNYYRLAIKSEPNNLTYQNNLALSLALIGRTEQAIAMLEIITAHPNATAQHRQNLALVYGMAGKSVDAMRYSRMDLSDTDARNNALYFQALNQPLQEEQIVAQSQANMMMAQAHAKRNHRPENTTRQPYTYIEANNETLALNTYSSDDTLTTKMLAQAAPASQNLRSIATARAPYTIIEASNETVALNTNYSDDELSHIQVVETPTAAPEFRSLETARRPQKLIEDNRAALAKDAKSETANTLAAKPKMTLGAEYSLSHYVDAPREVKTVIALANTPETSLNAAIRHTAFLEESRQVKNSTSLYYVQLASFRTPERAQTAWEMLSKRHGDLLKGYDPIFTVADLGIQKGVFYRVRIGGFANQLTPNEICSTLKTRSQDCYIPRVKDQVIVEDMAIAIANSKSEEKFESFEGEHTAHIAY